MTKLLKNIILILGFLSSTVWCFAQSASAFESTLNNPYNTIYTHLYYLQPDSYDPDKAATTIYGNPENARQLAIKLKQVLDGKGLYVATSTIPKDSVYSDTLSKRQVYILFPKVLPEVFVEKADDGKWYYSQETIKDIPRLHKKVYPFGSNILLNLVPKGDKTSFLGLKTWQYVGISILLILSFLLHKILSLVGRFIIKRIILQRFKDKIPDKKLIWKVARMVSLVAVVWLLIKLLPILQLPITSSTIVLDGLHIVLTIFGVYLLLRIIDVILFYSEKITEKTESTLDNQLLPLVRRSLYTIIIIFGIINILSLLDVNVTALIAGISIGGLALALAAQDTVKNFIGSATIFVDKPFQIGDWIIANGTEGVVEEVGFRSTRIRTFDDSLITVPNGTLANMVVNNMGMRVYRRFKTTLNLTYSTDPALIPLFVNGVKTILEKHPYTRKEGINVALTSMSSSSLDVFMSSFFAVEGFAQEIKGKQEIILAILELAKVLGIEFAFPSQSIYIENNGTQPTTTQTSTASPEERLRAFLAKYEDGLDVKEEDTKN